LIRLPLNEIPSPIPKNGSYFGFGQTQVHEIDRDSRMEVAIAAQGAKRFRIELGDKF
jgi:hypothetical protein